ncbi:hypothetical protein HBZS_122700 [Helicobacter bizzozeronii CCUG 35545]|nr:hypothetical protein HBZS_122700 [Helicobacter bizzozeronii CCUG 35545]
MEMAQLGLFWLLGLLTGVMAGFFWHWGGDGDCAHLTCLWVWL